VVFAKLWLARHWVAPEAELVCFDAGASWPLAPRPFDLVACHDAFYFLEPKAAILARLRGLLDPLNGILAVSHVHNREWANLSAGAAVTAAEMAALLPDAVLYDDAELTRALAESRSPRPSTPEALRGAEAFCAVEGPGLRLPRAVDGVLALPPEGAELRRNPLYDEGGAIAWPSDRYEREYGPRATYPPRSAAPDRAVLDGATAEAARRRELLDLPERW
jgi:hypothetical protein